MINILNANIISPDDVNGEYPAFGPTPPGGEIPAGCTVCTASCMGSCSGDCMGGCGDANCEGQCTLSCEAACSINCDITCRDTCSGGCNNECVNGCMETCTSGCSGACEGCTGCSGSCIDACVNGCKYSCQNVATTTGTHVVVPDWSFDALVDGSETQKRYYEIIRKPVEERTQEEIEFIEEINQNIAAEITDDGIKLVQILGTIKVYLDELIKYDYKRISELDEAVVVHDNDTLVGSVTIDGQTITIPDLDLHDLEMVVSDFDNKTVKITAASLAEFLKLNYKNYWVWTPYIEYYEDEPEVPKAIGWYLHTSFDETEPDQILLSSLITGNAGVVDEHNNGLMPSALFVKLNGKDFITHENLTGLKIDGTPAPVDTPLIRFAYNYRGNTDATNVLNAELAADLDARYAPSGVYPTSTEIANTYLTKTEAVNTYLSKTDAASTYLFYESLTGLKADHSVATEPIIRLADNFNGNTDQYNVFNTQLLADMDARYALAGTYPTAAFIEETYLSKAGAATLYFNKTQSDARYVTKAGALNEIPTRNANGGTNNGLMTSADVTNINTAITTANNAVSRLDTLANTTIPGLESQINSKIGRQSYASTDYIGGTATAGTVTIPVESSIVVGNNGVIDLKDFSVNNLIKNGTFERGFDNEWNISIYDSEHDVDVPQIDTATSSITDDIALNQTIARLSIIADGEISQQFMCDSRNGFTVGILFKRDAVNDKEIDVRIDGNSYVTHTITHGSGYYVMTMYFETADNSAIGYHTLYIHNPDTSNTVTYELTDIMVQQGSNYTGWNRNPKESIIADSVEIVSYGNKIVFRDKIEKYPEDVYAPDGVTILHHAGDVINPSSSIIMHKDKQYLYFHITAANEIDGPIRNNTIPLRVNLYTGECDISGNAVSAGYLRDIYNPNIVLNVPVAQINGFFDGTSNEFIKNLEYYNWNDSDVPYADQIAPKINMYFLRYTHIADPNDPNDESTYVILGNMSLVGTFGSDRNGEIFNDYVNNTATGDFSHAEGQANTASGAVSHVEGASNAASGYAAHAQGYSTIASGAYQDVSGKFNIEDNNNDYATIVGNGTANNARSNAYTLDWDGNAVFSGTVTATEFNGANNGKAAMQYATIPTASSDSVGKIIQYTGASVANSYQKGCFYVGVNNGGVYSWQNIITDRLASANNDGMITSSMYNDIVAIPTTYLTQSDASSTYLSQSDASSTYLTQSNASSTYLTKSDASSTYLSQSDASNTYLTKSDASDTYLTQSNASSTYLSQTDAATTYMAKADMGLATNNEIDTLFT